MIFKITLPTGSYSTFSGILHESCPIQFEHGIGFYDSDFFPPKYKNILTVMVGEPKIEECPTPIVEIVSDSSVIKLETNNGIVDIYEPPHKRGRKSK